jgi:DNA polymerase I
LTKRYPDNGCNAFCERSHMNSKSKAHAPVAAPYVVAPNTLFIIDGSSFLYRAYYGMQPLHTPQGEPVHAVYTFCRMMKKMIDQFSIQNVLLVWDSKGPTERHELYPEYKATRQAPPSDLFEQKKLIVEFAQLIELEQVEMPGIEADDVIYSLARTFAADGMPIIIVSSDKDLYQMLNDQVTLYDEFKDRMVDVAAAECKLGIPVSKIPFYYALVGDSSDNIPGVKGIGPKTAQAIVNKYTDLDDLYSGLERAGSVRVQELLRINEHNARLSLTLFTLRIHEVGITPAQAVFDRSNWALARSLFERLNFTSLLKGLGVSPIKHSKSSSSIGSLAVAVSHNYRFELIATRTQLENLCVRIRSAGVVAVDTETNSVRALQCELVGISLCIQEGEAYYIPIGHKVGGSQLGLFAVAQHDERDVRQLSLAVVQEILGPVLADASCKKIFHHAKFDKLVLYAHGFKVQGVIFDTLIAAHLVTPEWQRIGLKKLSKAYLGEDMLSYQDVVKGDKYADFSYVPIESALEYAAADAHQTFRLKPIFEKMLDDQGLNSLFVDMELPVEQVLFEIECAGILLNDSLLAQLGTKVHAEIVSIEQKMCDFAQLEVGSINFNSPKQVADLLFNQLNLPVQKKSSQTGVYSTDQEVLEVLATQHPIPGLIMKYRELQKLKSTYIESLPLFINPRTGRIHTTLSQIVTATGRLASSEPNLQNIPVEGASSVYGMGIRRAFEPAAGNFFVSADYSQIELRVLAYITQDPALINAFLTDADIHACTAAGIFGVSTDAVTNEQRQLGKRINFSILYGLTPFGLSKDLNISMREAKEYIDRFFMQYKRVAEWIEEVVVSAQACGYVKTLWGRRRYVPDINEKNRTLHEQGKRVAVNTIIQGTAAEIMKKGMIDLRRVYAEKNYSATMILQIHDELLIEVPSSELVAVEALTKTVLESVVQWNVPLIVTTSHGAHWQDVTK